MNLPQEVTALLEALLAELRRILKHNLLGVYLRGSLATGDFNAETSDLDVLAVTELPVNDAEFAALADLHARLATAHPWGRRLEMAYIDRAALRRFTPNQRHVTLYQGETLQRALHGSNWLLERWTVREHGVTLLGPAPQTLIDPIPPAEVRAAVRDRLPDWDDWANHPDDPDWLLLPRSHKAYVVESMCRALCTLATGELPSKQQAVAWGMENLPEPWHSLVVRSRAWRTDKTVDHSILPEVRAFVHWAAAQARSL
jgi:predicted nucleotidyltransferase